MHPFYSVEGKERKETQLFVEVALYLSRLTSLLSEREIEMIQGRIRGTQNGWCRHRDQIKQGQVVQKFLAGVCEWWKPHPEQNYHSNNLPEQKMNKKLATVCFFRTIHFILKEVLWQQMNCTPTGTLTLLDLNRNVYYYIRPHV